MSEFSYKIISNEDLPLLAEWWHDWGWETHPTADMLPKNGILVFNGDIPVYAGFLYTTGTAVGWIEYVVSNKKADVSLRRGGLQFLINGLGLIAKMYGIRVLFTSTIDKAFVQSLKKCGFEIGDVNNYQLLKRI